jgi:hypothetical protein
MEDDAMQIGKTATVRVSVLMEYTVEVEMPVDGDVGKHADLELFLTGSYDEYSEKDVVNTDIVEEEPIWEDERPEYEWPTYI